MVEGVRLPIRDRLFFLLLLPFAAASLPSLLLCAVDFALWLHGAVSRGPVMFHLPARNLWDALFALHGWAYGWVARWNAVSTLAATAFFVTTLLRRRWRPWLVLALIPYGLLLCADFALRWRHALLP
jgi:hypothetical protein